MVDRTNAERQRRYIARLKAAGQPDPASADKLAAAWARSDKLRTRIAELEAELARRQLRRCSFCAASGVDLVSGRLGAGFICKPCADAASAALAEPAPTT